MATGTSSWGKKNLFRISVNGRDAGFPLYLNIRRVTDGSDGDHFWFSLDEQVCLVGHAVGRQLSKWTQGKHTR